ncbi:hypothetical protein [Aneurinibacillus tyrosinisolvens]|nr:hypothetical protein [Aneurinibacillus tyrosinisolvens]
MTYITLALIGLFIANKFRVLYNYKKNQVSLKEVDDSLIAMLNNERDKS